MSSQLNPVPPPAGPPGPDARLSEKWRALSFCFPAIPSGEAHSAFRAVRRSEPRPWAGAVFARHLGAAANSARPLPLDARRDVRAKGDAVLDELRAQFHAALPLPEDDDAPGLVACVTDHIEQAAALHREVLSALSDGRVTAAELDGIRQRLARTNATGAFLARRVDADVAKLTRGAA